MAEGAPEATAPEGAGSIKAALGKKLGPFPAGVWIVIALVIFYYVSKKQKGGEGGGQEIDPAGNVGTIDPATGYVSGSAEDRAALGGGSSSLGSDTDTGTGGSTVSGGYADNNAWAVAAINYLVSIGVDATSANAAITQFLASQKLTPQQQGEVNLAIQRLGAPPSPPEPGGSPPPIVTPPSSSTYATNPPTGFTTTSVTATSVGLKWNATTNAASYTLRWGTTSAVKGGSTTVSTTTATAHGLKANTLYHFSVQANPVKSGAPSATLTKTTAKTSGGGGSKPGEGGSKKEPYKHTVTKDGESFSSIAKQYHYAAGGHALWVYNYTSSPHTAAAKAKIKQRGPDLIVHGETVYIPRS